MVRHFGDVVRQLLSAGAAFRRLSCGAVDSAALKIVDIRALICTGARVALHFRTGRQGG
jgi:hypothetical protein